MSGYRYTGNKDSRDGTEVLILSDGSRVALGGVAELNKEELKTLEERFEFEAASKSPKTAKEDDQEEGGEST